MRRRRCQAVLASDEDEYLQILEERDRNAEIEDKKFQKLSTKKFEDDSDDDDYGMLGCSSAYTLEEIQPTLKELEEKDEEDLTKEIEKINLYVKQQGNSAESIKNSYQLFSSPKSNNERISTSVESSPIISQKFFEQNVVNYEKKIKLIVIGKTKSGKTLFINKLLSEMQDQTKSPISEEYIPTTSLVYSKMNYCLDSLNIQIELIDTNESICNSQMIKTYYQISNGVFIIIRNFEEDLDFVVKQIEKIHSVIAEPNIMLIFSFENSTKEKEDNIRDTFIKNYSIKNFVFTKIKDVNIKELKEFNQFITYISGSF